MREYIDLVKRILSEGKVKQDRTKIGTISSFGERMVFNLSGNKIPLLTTKRMNIDLITKELLWFLRGETNSKILSEQGVKIWDFNGSKEFLVENGFPERKEGDLGPIYGFQWRHWGAKYINCDTDYSNQGIDQIKNVIEGIKKDPFSRRHIISAWNVSDIPNMVLPPCHCMFQLYVDDDGLSGQLYQRSADVGLGVPFNIASYSIFLHLIAKMTNLTAKKLVYITGDTHIYLNHLEGLKEQITRIPKEPPTIEIKGDSFDNFSVELKNYDCHKYIKLPIN